MIDRARSSRIILTLPLCRENHVKTYEMPDILQNPDLSLIGKVYVITGANAGIGREMTTFLASKGASCFMICRSAGRANAARDQIIEQTKNTNVHVILCDCSLEGDVRRAWEGGGFYSCTTGTT